MSRLVFFPAPSEGGGALKPHRGTMVLVFGILGLVCCVAFGIAAWVLGNQDLKEMAAGVMDRTGEGMTNAGKILGIISVVLTVVGVVIYAIVFLTVGVGGFLGR
ncbi:MAG: DUF4190 domain-containing protein [Planctomycetes bacterium]|nr:DUF4190 domain-containing protein [Planctomycetota bacterium]